MIRRSLVAVVILTAGTVPAEAVVFSTITTNPGTLVTTGVVDSFSPRGSDMDGMEVTVRFADGDTQTATWGDLVPGSGSASGTTTFGKQWSLSQSGDTFGTAGSGWNLTVQSSLGVPLVELVLNGVPGDTMFDLKDPGDLTPGIGSLEFTPGSERGWTLEVLNGAPGGPFGGFNLNLGVSYEDAVKVGANPVLNDLYTTLKLTFGGDQNGLPDGFTLLFYQDTDLSAEPFNQPDLPEPSSLLIFAGLGAIAGGGCWRRRTGRLSRQKSSPV
jgi:hypothetical protein